MKGKKELLKWMEEKAKPFKISDLEMIKQRFRVTFKSEASSLKK